MEDPITWLTSPEPKDAKRVHFSKLDGFIDVPTRDEVLKEIVILSASTVLGAAVLFYCFVMGFSEAMKIFLIR